MFGVAGRLWEVNLHFWAMEGRWDVVFRPEKRKSQARGLAFCLHVCIFFGKLTGNHVWSAIAGSIEALLFIC
jgi:hypothetical protein